MKTNRHLQFPGIGFSRSTKTMVLPVAVSLFLATGLMGQLANPPQGEKAAPPVKQEPLLDKVMADLPHYGKAPVSAVEPKPTAEATPETVTLVPFVVLGEKRTKLTESELHTKKAFAAEIFKRYDYSAFSLFQHKEDVRLEEMAALQNYADNLALYGDVEGSRAIKKESSRLFLRPHDPESEYVVSIFNPRIR